MKNIPNTERTILIFNSTQNEKASFILCVPV